MAEEHLETTETEVEEVQSEQSIGVPEAEDSDQISGTPAVKTKKHHLAKALVAEAKEMVDASHAQLEECRLLLESDLAEYNKAKASLRANALEQSEVLLEELGYEPSDEEEDTLVFEPKEEVEPIALRDISSGRFTGLILALLVGLAAVLAAIYYATEKLSMTLDLSKYPEQSTIEKIFGWFAQLVGYTGENGWLVGLAIVALGALLLMWIVYAIRVSLKASKNLHFAQKQLDSTKEYVAYKSSCKEEMDKVDAHIKDAIATLKDYEILLAEQNGKLRRIMHFEGFHDDQREYRESSQQTMSLTETLVDTIKRFIATPMSEEGKLSGKSTLFLHSAKEKIRKVLDEIG